MSTAAESGIVSPRAEQSAIDLTQLPPAPPTTVAVIEGIATGGPRREVEHTSAAGRVSELFV